MTQVQFESLATGSQLFRIASEAGMSGVSEQSFLSYSEGLQYYKVYQSLGGSMPKERFLSLTRGKQRFHIYSLL